MKIPALFLLLAWASIAHAQQDSSHGAALYKSQCMMCHSLNANGIGPAHKGLLGRKAGSFPGYAYSPALKNANIVWDEKTLTEWLADPEKLIPGQKMNFVVAKESDRSDIVAFLKTTAAN